MCISGIRKAATGQRTLPGKLCTTAGSPASALTKPATAADGGCSPPPGLSPRLPRSRAQQALELSCTQLDLGDGIEVGSARLRTLFPHGTLYSQFVTTGTSDEAAFQREISLQLQGAAIRCKVVVGRARRAQNPDADIAGFSLMLHELSPEQSLAMQASGLGAGRKFGCGIFVPHKSAAAVGA